MNGNRLCGSLFLLLSCGPALGADWGLDASAGFAHDDNVSNALDAADRKSDSAVTLNLSAGLHGQIDESTGLGLSLVAESATYARYTGLSNLGLGMRAHLRRKLGLGAGVPWVAVAARAVHRDYHYDYRDGWQYDASAALGKRFGERWEVRGIARYDKYAADHLQPEIIPGLSSAAYDVAGRTFAAQAAYLLTEVDTLSLSYSWRKGTVTAVTPPDFEILGYSDAVARDPVFESNLIAYRIQGKTDTVSINWSHALGRHSSVNLGYAYLRTTAEAEELESYYTNLINLSVSYSR